MKKLIIDTSTNFMYVGLLDGKKQVYKTRLGKNDNSAYLVNVVKTLLEENDTTLDNIDCIIVGVGPGSYTGLRVGVVVAKTFAYTKNIKLKSISSLKLLSSGYDNDVYAMIDARRGYYFALKHKLGKTIIDDHYIKGENISIDENKVVLNESTIKVDLETVVKYAEEVVDVHSLEPNYLRKTEAEPNYDQKNGN